MAGLLGRRRRPDRQELIENTRQFVLTDRVECVGIEPVQLPESNSYRIPRAHSGRALVR
jgi:hypothetical protein